MDGDGDKDTNDPWDAIHAAANYLGASGAPEDWRSAIFAYNHADWYVTDVLAAAEKYEGAATGNVAVCSTAAPNERIAQMIAEADRLTELRPRSSYVWGGSHGLTPTPRNGPFDYSSAVSHLLQVGGFGNPTNFDKQQIEVKAAARKAIELAQLLSKAERERADSA